MIQTAQVEDSDDGGDHGAEASGANSQFYRAVARTFAKQVLLLVMRSCIIKCTRDVMWPYLLALPVASPAHEAFHAARVDSHAGGFFCKRFQDSN